MLFYLRRYVMIYFHLLTYFFHGYKNVQVGSVSGPAGFIINWTLDPLFRITDPWIRMSYSEITDPRIRIRKKIKFPEHFSFHFLGTVIVLLVFNTCFFSYFPIDKDK
jgi:hypothetical protein